MVRTRVGHAGADHPSPRVDRKGSLYSDAPALYEVHIGTVAQDAKLARRSIYGSATLQGTSQVI